MHKSAIVAGTGFQGRARIIRTHCREGAKVILRRDKSNAYDSNAIAVMLQVPRFFGLLGLGYRQIGYIKAVTAKHLAKRIDEGVEMHAMVSSYWVPPGRDYPRVSIRISDEFEQTAGTQPRPGSALG